MNADTSASPREQVGHALKTVWWLPLLRGLLLIILGAYALFQPGMTAVAFTQVLAIFLIIDGILAIILAIMGETPSRLWTIVRGLVGILVGGFVFAYPVLIAGLTATTILYVIAFGAIIGGGIEVFGAIRDRKEIEGAGWMVVSGILAILFGIAILCYPLASAGIMIRVIGVYAILFGASLIGFAFQLRKTGNRLMKPRG